MMLSGDTIKKSMAKNEAERAAFQKEMVELIQKMSDLSQNVERRLFQMDERIEASR